MIRTFPHGLENNHECNLISVNFPGMYVGKTVKCSVQRKVGFSCYILDNEKKERCLVASLCSLHFPTRVLSRKFLFTAQGDEKKKLGFFFTVHVDRNYALHNCFRSCWLWQYHKKKS